PSTTTPHSNRLPTSLASRSIVAVKHGQPSSAIPGVIGDSLQLVDDRPEASQLPLIRALRNSSRRNPVRYRNVTDSFAMDASIQLAFLAEKPSERARRHRSSLRRFLINHKVAQL